MIGMKIFYLSKKKLSLFIPIKHLKYLTILNKSNSKLIYLNFLTIIKIHTSLHPSIKNPHQQNN